MLLKPSEIGFTKIRVCPYKLYKSSSSRLDLTIFVILALFMDNIIVVIYPSLRLNSHMSYGLIKTGFCAINVYHTVLIREGSACFYPFYTVSYNMKWVKTSCTYSTSSYIYHVVIHKLCKKSEIK